MKIARVLFLASLVALLAIAGYVLGKRMQAGRAGLRPSGTTPSPAKPGDDFDHSAAPDRSPAGLLARVFEKLRTGGLAPGELDWLRRQLLAADPAEAMAAITAFLATGQDARTGEIFALTKGGELGGAPTMRVMLLDVFGRICRDTGSNQAEVFARALLERKTSADEWAVALRNIAWSAPGDRSYLAEKMRDMLGYQPWRQQPAAGFLEAFDILVFTRDVTFVSDLGAMVRSEDEALKRAAAVALDRFSDMAPLDVMTYLNEHPGEFADRPFLRADYYSKADLSQAAQRAAVEAYLGRPDVSLAEKDKLLSVFASPGSFVGDTLVTQPPLDDASPQRIAGLQKAVDEWLKVNRFPNLSGSIGNLRGKLAE